MWLTGLAIGALFGWCWGWTAGRRSVVILPATAEALPESGAETGAN